MCTQSLRDAFDSLVRLQTVASSPAALRDPKNAAAISADLGKLAALSHAFPSDPKSQEPATAALSSLFIGAGLVHHGHEEHDEHGHAGHGPAHTPSHVAGTSPGHG